MVYEVYNFGLLSFQSDEMNTNGTNLVFSTYVRSIKYKLNLFELTIQYLFSRSNNHIL